jgi:LPXTG-motif cell wall-anchored protein
VAATSDGPAPTSLPYTSSVTPSTAASSSLPFTGADVEGLAVVGGAAVVAGALLLRRRRHTA